MKSYRYFNQIEGKGDRSAFAETLTKLGRRSFRHRFLGLGDVVNTLAS